MSGAGAFSWNSELPSGHSPYWIQDEGLAAFGLHRGDAVSVDTRAEPRSGDLVVVEADLGDESRRMARRYTLEDDRVRLDPLGGDEPPLELPAESVIVMGVIRGRLRLQEGGAGAIEEPLPPPCG